jgi:hypothetical protein
MVYGDPAPRIEQEARVGRATHLYPTLMANPRDSKTVRLVVIVVLALIVAYLLYSAS